MSLPALLTFNRSQRTGLVLLVILLLLLGGGALAIRLFPDQLPTGMPPVFLGKKSDSREFAHKKTRRPALHSISLNDSDAEQLMELPGIGKVLSARIVKFRDRIGGFSSLEELRKVYGLSDTTYRVVLPYLTLGTLPEKPTRKLPEMVEINTADTAAWATLPGIGKVLSQRIVKYREARGGFKSMEDLAKVYGLSPETFAAIQPYLVFTPPPSTETTAGSTPKAVTEPSTTPTVFPAKKTFSGTVDLNTADSTQLVQIPGFGPKIAPRVLKFRQILGFYSDADLVKKVYGLSEENYQRARPFLEASVPASHAYLNLNGTTPKKLEIMALLTPDELTRLLSARTEVGRFSTWDEVAAAGLSPQSLSRLKIYFRL